jgi:hypothetical protein
MKPPAADEAQRRGGSGEDVNDHRLVAEAGIEGDLLAGTRRELIPDGIRLPAAERLARGRERGLCNILGVVERQARDHGGVVDVGVRRRLGQRGCGSCY